ncbi:MAG: S41 family peptidase [Acidobacteriota bacterium]
MRKRSLLIISFCLSLFLYSSPQIQQCGKAKSQPEVPSYSQEHSSPDPQQTKRREVSLILQWTNSSSSSTVASIQQQESGLVEGEINSVVAQGGEAPVTITGMAAVNALGVFEAALNERWSYRHANNADFAAAIAALRKRIVAGISSNDLGIELQKIIALGIDGHSGVYGYRLPPGGCLPFLIETSGERFVAFTPERRAFLADGFPFLTRIDGQDIAKWCATVAVLVPKGSPQYIRHRSLSLLREIDYWRSQMNLPKKDTVEVQLTDQHGRANKILTLPVAKSPFTYGVWPSGGSHLLESNIGYLRLASMGKTSSVAEIKLWMPKFRDTAGLIVDVRDNNGGDRDALLLLYSYLAALEAPPRVFNAAAYRLHSAHKENHLAENHRMYRAGAKEWSPRERQAVVEFAKTFKPQWELPKGQFSDWHYIALSRLDDPDIYHYDKPVIVLMNNKSFSATDIFLAGLKGVKNVLLLGTPSSGGSAFTQEIVLDATPLRLRIGSMASFQADGKLFDGNGVQPDVLVEPAPEYYIGVHDNVLEEGVKRIRAR